MSTFNIGDLVKLKGTDVQMLISKIYTVKRYLESEYVEANCLWFDKQHNLQNGDFDLNLLVKVE